MAYTHRARPIDRRPYSSTRLPHPSPFSPFQRFRTHTTGYRGMRAGRGVARQPGAQHNAAKSGEGADKIGISNCYVENARWDPRLFCTQPPDRGAYAYPPPPTCVPVIIRMNQPSLPPCPGREGANAESLPPSDICSNPFFPQPQLDSIRITNLLLKPVIEKRKGVVLVGRMYGR